MNWQAYQFAPVVLVAMATLGWLYSVVRRNVNIVDIMWSCFFLAACITYYASMPGTANALRADLVLALVAIWALRLAVYLGWRSHGAPEDRRYGRIRASNEPFWLRSLYLVFGLQALLAWIISLPLFGAIHGHRPISTLDLAGYVLWLFGMCWESAADWQLARFKANPANQGRVMNTGVWRYCRHPNYFGECCLWWGYYLVACAAGAWWSLPAPALMTLLLLRVSGVTLLEADIRDRRPEYAEYVATTNSFIPWRPRCPVPAQRVPL
ncbi:MAG: DUF1295 domain-containing protein [Burkholderiales bacterium]|nr:DUF1295 domain-containing protein [Burkholderiales bacterium]